MEAIRGFPGAHITLSTNISTHTLSQKVKEQITLFFFLCKVNLHFSTGTHPLKYNQGQCFCYGLFSLLHHNIIFLYNGSFLLVHKYIWFKKKYSTDSISFKSLCHISLLVLSNISQKEFLRSVSPSSLPMPSCSHFIQTLYFPLHWSCSCQVHKRTLYYIIKGSFVSYPIGSIRAIWYSWSLLLGTVSVLDLWSTKLAAPSQFPLVKLFHIPYLWTLEYCIL